MEETFEEKYDWIVFISIMFLIIVGCMIAARFELLGPGDSAERVERAAEIEGNGV